MSFDIHVAREAQHTRVALQGQASLGQLFSLLQVLEVDCAQWPGDAVVLDLGGLVNALAPGEKAQVEDEARRRLARIARVRVRWTPGPSGGWEDGS